ncbi:sugar phosphate isomerase/epimerase family protein [Rosistilla ulvae]|nr:sugar phosphate isomerase/epimerase family protein [Rosistilla ulvae]
MKSLKTEQAIDAIAEIGFDAIEIAVRPDWESAPANMPPKRRTAIRKQLFEKQLRLSSLMEHLEPSHDDRVHRKHLDRLSQVFELAEAWQPNQKPLVQTTLGGGHWDKRRTFYVDRVGDWLATAKEHEIVLAVKPHRGGGMSRPSEAAWLIQQLGNSPNLRMVYDYSHYAFRDMPLNETVATALPYTAHVALKDVRQRDGKVDFLLPGATGNVDFPNLFRQFYTGGYRGDMNCEVSGMVWGKPGYQPIESARQCYAWMSQAMQQANVPRV